MPSIALHPTLVSVDALIILSCLSRYFLARFTSFEHTKYTSTSILSFRDNRIPQLPLSSSSRLLSSISSSSVSQDPHIHHAFIVKNGLELDSFFSTELLLAYYTNEEISIARSLFAIFFEPSTHFLNSRLKELSEAGFFKKILDLYYLLRLSESKPDNFTFPYVLKACACLSAFKQGKSIHSHVHKSGYGDNVFVANSLIDMYSKFGSLWSANKVFDQMPSRNLVSWNCMISGYALNGFPDMALELCTLMKYEGMSLDKVGLKIVLPACGQLGALRLGRSAHAHLIVSGLSSDTVLVTAIMDMYAKCGSMDVSERLFNEIPHKDVVTWNAMITGYSQRSQLEMVLRFFYKMQVENVKPSFVTALITLQACADLSILRTGEIIHGYITRLGLSSDESVEALLINMYSKCGKLNLAYQVFQAMTKEDVNSWSALIHGLGMHGYGNAALMGFFKMLKRGINPDGICFLLVLSSCSHTGLVNEGCKIFDYMVAQFGIQPKMEHYVTMVDLMGRAGFIEEAFQFIGRTPMEPDISIWGAFFGACKIHGDFKMVKLFKERLVESDPRTAGYYKLLLNIYASNGSWDEVLKITSLMEEREVHKVLGYSIIEINR
ncbi:hypothetical protein HHK36_028944 [Tetracentron sinense]|uniref:Pentatricopeptide repeat-containing protein n=1 Tax=Tetracentron sinense TaxID=13715 RepID=A0A834YC37_TETSI|nr:hypothetical protein HHK36_028944 [Tetracentron sinense]